MKTDRIPEIYCSLTLIFQEKVHLSQVIESLKEKGVPILKIHKLQVSPQWQESGRMTSPGVPKTHVFSRISCKWA